MEVVNGGRGDDGRRSSTRERTPRVVVVWTGDGARHDVGDVPVDAGFTTLSDKRRSDLKVPGE